MKKTPSIDLINEAKKLISDHSSNDSQIINTIQDLSQKNALSETENEALTDSLRNMADRLVNSNTNLELGQEFMNIAALRRPQGQYIKNRLQYFKNLIQARKDQRCEIQGIMLNFGADLPINILRAIADGRYEGEEASLLKDHLSDGEVVLEVGGGLGFLGILAGKMNRCKRYVSYEANPALIPLIKKNMADNNVSFEIHNELLVSKASGGMPFYVRPHFWASGMTKPSKGNYQEVMVQTANKNKVIAELEPTLLILDIEGGEVAFLKDLAMPSVKKMILEIHPWILDNRELTQVYHSMIRMGFVRNFNVSRNGVELWEKPD